jgi:hypothetical protein
MPKITDYPLADVLKGTEAFLADQNGTVSVNIAALAAYLLNQFGDPASNNALAALTQIVEQNASSNVIDCGPWDPDAPVFADARWGATASRRVLPNANRADFAPAMVRPGEVVVDERGIPWFGDASGRPGGVSHRATDDGNTFDRAMFDRLRDQAVSIMDAYLPTDPDFTAAARRVLATGKNLFLPSRVGGYPISDGLVMSSDGQQIISDGAYHGYFRVTSNFNLSAPGVITILTSANEHQSGLTNVGILFEQPNTPTSMSQIIKYPWAINAPGVARMSFNGVIRIEDAWNGLNFIGNVGGLVADDFEISAYNRAYIFDGALDSVHITTLKLWPFIASNTSQAFALYAQALGGYIGHVDGLDIKTIAHFAQPLVVDTTTNGGGIGTIGALQMDGAGSKLTWNNHGYRVGNLYTTASTATISTMEINGGFLSVAGLYLQGASDVAGASAAPLILLKGGQFQVTKPFMSGIGPGQTVIQQSGGILDWEGGIFNTDPNASYTVPLIHITGGFATISKPRFLPTNASGNVAIKVETDNYHDIEINVLSGWARSVPASPTTSTFRFGSTLIGGPSL